MKNIFKLFLVLSGFSMALIASSGKLDAQKNEKKKKHGEGCIGKGICGKTKQGKELAGQYRVW
ncbi:MAG: hypothetical protein ACXWV2_12490 [Chitinophagaceae bacterium]